MTEVSFDGFKFDLTKIKEGFEVDRQNKFLQKYDKDGNSIFSAEEIAELQADLEKASGDDKKLSNSEMLNLYVAKMGINIDEAKQKFAQYGNIVQKGVETILAKDNKYIIKVLGELIENHGGSFSVDSEKFKNTFKFINKNNVVDILKKYSLEFNGKNLITDIMNEKTGSEGNRINYVKTLYNLLYSQIDKNKYDTSVIEKDFQEFLKNPLLNSEINKLDKIFNSMIAMVEGKNTQGNIGLQQTTELAIERNNEARNMTEKSAESQGVVSKALDGIGGLSQKDVESAINKHQKKLEQLRDIDTMSEDVLMTRFGTKDRVEAKKIAFKIIFGVEYKPEAVANYEMLDSHYKNADLLNKMKQFIQTTFEKELQTPGIYKSSDYFNFYNKMCEHFGDKGQEIVDNYLKENNAENCPISQKYIILRGLLMQEKKKVDDNFSTICNGKDFSEIKNDRNNAFIAAYGYENDTYLKAQDWIEQQQTRMTVAQIATQVAATAGAMFTGGGSLALLSTAVLVTDPITLAEIATDANGMTKDDWSNYMNTRAEIAGWMAVGGFCGALGGSLANISKLKGLSKIAQKMGMSLDDLITKADLPNDIKAMIIKTENLATAKGVTLEAFLDISLTATLQEEGATGIDCVMSICSALTGTSLGNRLVGFNEPDAAIKELRKHFPQVNEDNAGKIIAKLREMNGKLKKWAEENSGGSSNRLYSGIDPGRIVERFSNALDNCIDRLVSGRHAVKLEELKTTDNKMYNAVNDTLNKILNNVLSGNFPAKGDLKKWIDEIAQQTGVNSKILEGHIQSALKCDEWKPIKMFFDQSSSFYKSKSNIDSINKALAKFRLANNLYSETHENAIKSLYSNLESRLFSGEIPSKELFDQVIADASKEFGVDPVELQYSLTTRMSYDENWTPFRMFFQKTADNVDVNSANECVNKLKKARGYDDSQSTKIEPLSQEVKSETEPIKTESSTQNIEPEGNAETTNSSAKIDDIDYDKLYESHPEIDNKFNSIENEHDVLRFLDNYTNLINGDEINFNNFEDYSYQIYREIQSNCPNLTEHEQDTLFNIIKNKFHKNVVAEETRINDIKSRPELKGIRNEDIYGGEKLIEEIKMMMKNGETFVDDNFIDERLRDIMGNDYDYRKVGLIEEYVYSNPDIKNYLNDCTHRDIRNNKIYSCVYQPETIENCISILDNLLGLHNQGQQITLDDINRLKNKPDYRFDENLPKLLDDILLNHHTLGPIYKQLLEV